MFKSDLEFLKKGYVFHFGHKPIIIVSFIAFAQIVKCAFLLLDLVSEIKLELALYHCV